MLHGTFFISAYANSDKVWISITTRIFFALALNYNASQQGWHEGSQTTFDAPEMHAMYRHTREGSITIKFYIIRALN